MLITLLYNNHIRIQRDCGSMHSGLSAKRKRRYNTSSVTKNPHLHPLDNHLQMKNEFFPIESH